MKTMNITINFDMDGTIADLYANPNWLPMLRAFDPTPYATAKPLLRLNILARKLNELQKQGYEIAIISWLSKESNPAYDEAVTATKMAWLAEHQPSDPLQPKQTSYRLYVHQHIRHVQSQHPYPLPTHNRT